MSKYARGQDGAAWRIGGGRQGTTPSSTRVQRSMSLQQHKRPDRNNNSNNSNTLATSGNYFSCGNFQLANLLARAASYDAKWSRELREGQLGVEETEQSRDSSGDEEVEDSTQRRESVSREGRIELPERYRILLPKFDEDTGSEDGLDSNLVDSSLADDEELTTGSRSRDQLRKRPKLYPTGGGSLSDREQDLDVALQWIQQELRSLRVQDRAIMRQLFALGTTVRRLKGDLETISCQTVTDETLDVINDVSETEISTDVYEDDPSASPLGSQYRAVSMVTVNSRSPKNPSLARRLWSRFQRSFDQQD